MKIGYWFRRKWSQVKRVIDFLPLVWKGYDWDYHYAVELFQHQLKRMADHIGSDKAWALEHKQTASRIRTAVELMQKIYDEEYVMEYYDIMEEKYGKTSFECIETGKFDDKGDPYYTMEIYYENYYTEEELQLIAEERRQLVLECRDKQKRAHKLLWDFVEHNIQRWWD
jgi:hypothetical protein